MKRALLRCVTCMLAFFASACFTFEAAWERIDSAALVAPDGTYRVELPVGWARNGMILTRDGYPLQSIVFYVEQLSEVDKIMHEHHLDPVQSDYLSTLQDAVRVRLPAAPGVEILDSAPATIGGCPAFRFHTREAPRGEIWAFFDAVPSHVWRERVAYIVTSGDQACFFWYEAPALYYFQRDLPTFERFVQSLEFLPPASNSNAHAAE